MATTMTRDELLALPLTTDVPTAGRCFGMCDKSAYRAVREGTFPVPVLRLGRRIVVLRAALLAAMGVPDDASSPAVPAIAHEGTHLSLVAAPAEHIRSDAARPRDVA